MKAGKFFERYKILHLFFWMLIFGLWFYLRYQDYSTIDKAFKVTLIKVTDLAIMIYFTNYILIPGLLYKKKYLLFIAAFVLMITVSSISKMYVIGHVINSPA